MVAQVRELVDDIEGRIKRLKIIRQNEFVPGDSCFRFGGKASDVFCFAIDSDARLPSLVLVNPDSAILTAAGLFSCDVSTVDGLRSFPEITPPVVVFDLINMVNNLGNRTCHIKKGQSVAVVIDSTDVELIISSRRGPASYLPFVDTSKSRKETGFRVVAKELFKFFLGDRHKGVICD